MKYLNLIFKNIFRKKTRLILTLGSFSVALFLFGLLLAIQNAFYQGVDVAGADRLITRHKVSLIMLLPHSYKEKMKQIKGVKYVSSGTWFGGVYQDQKNFFPQFAIEGEDHLNVYPEFKVKEKEWNDYLNDREGCVVGKTLAERFNWKVGDRIPIQGTIFQGIWEFNIRAIYTGSKAEDDLSQFWFQYKYLEERSRISGQVGWYIIRVENPELSFEVSKAIDSRFANSPYETLTDTEQAFNAGFVKQFGNIRLLLMTVGLVVFFTLLLVTGSTMSMAVRERTGEIGILKTIGFSDKFVLFIVLAESLTYSFLGGGLGLLLIKLFTLKGDPTGGMLPLFYLSPMNIITGMLLTLFIGALSGAIPAINSMNLKIVDALRRV